MSLIGGGSIGLTVAQGWILAGVGACFIAWGDIGHELLTHPISLDWSWPNSNATTPSTGSTTATGQPMVITVIDGGANNGGETVITNGDGTGADSGGWSTADQTDLAWTAAIACAAARAKKPGDINYAEGFLSLDGSIPPESYGPIVGYGPQDTHSEQVIVDYWRDTRLPQLHPYVKKTGSHLVLMIFTRVPMCPSCKSMVPTWIQELAVAAGPGVTIHFYLWQSIDPYDSVGSGNLEPVPGI